MWHEKDNESRSRLPSGEGIAGSDDTNPPDAPAAVIHQGVEQIDDQGCTGPDVSFGDTDNNNIIEESDAGNVGALRPSVIKAREKAQKGVEQIHDDVGPTDAALSMEGGGAQSYLTRGKGTKGAVEEIHDDDDGPAHHNNHAVASGKNFDERKAPPMGEEEAVELKPPVPLQEFGNDDDALQKQRARDMISSAPDSDRDTEAQPILTRPEDVRGNTNNNNDMGTETSNAPELEDLRENINNNNDMETETSNVPELEREPSLPIIPNAVLVEENEEEDPMVISGYAEPMPPWYKQKRTQQLLVLIAIIIVLAFVGIGVALGVRPKPAEGELSEGTNEPTSSPTSCSYKISKNAQQLDDLPVDQPGYLVLAADSSNLLLVTRDINSQESIYLIFYAWDGNEWKQKNFVVEEADENGLLFSADVAGGTALVGFPSAGFDSKGAVYIYNQNNLGFWGKAASSLRPDDEGSMRRFGESVSLDGELACTSGNIDGEGSYVYLFELEGGEWVQYDTIGPFDIISDCSVAGEIIAVKVYEEDLHLYRYDQQTNKAGPLQEAVTVNSTKVKRIGATALSERHLLLAVERFNFIDGWRPKEVLTYQRQDSGSYNLVQQLNASDFDEEFGSALDLEGDFLVINGMNKTYTFAEQDGVWEEQEAVIDEPYREYQVVGRNIIGVTEKSEVVTFNIDGCIQPVPTQTPSTSLAPSPISSTAPSRISSFKPSFFPSSSLIPTESCFWVEVSLVHDPYPDEVSWKIEQINESGKIILAESEEYENYVDYVTNERFCLKEGLYQFVVNDSGGDGMCCLYGDGSDSFGAEGSYELSSDGVVLAQGGEFEYSESVTFSIPVPMNSTSTSTTAPGESLIDTCAGRNKKECIKDSEACEYDNVEGKCFKSK